MSGKLTVSQTIHDKLTVAFQPLSLEIIDESEQHRGHGGWREGGETHFRVVMVAAALDGLNRVAQQRAVYGALKEELAGGVRALVLDVKGANV